MGPPIEPIWRFLWAQIRQPRLRAFWVIVAIVIGAMMQLQTQLRVSPVISTVIVAFGAAVIFGAAWLFVVFPLVRLDDLAFGVPKQASDPSNPKNLLSHADARSIWQIPVTAQKPIGNATPKAVLYTDDGRRAREYDLVWEDGTSTGALK